MRRRGGPMRERGSSWRPSRAVWKPCRRASVRWDWCWDSCRRALRKPAANVRRAPRVCRSSRRCCAKWPSSGPRQRHWMRYASRLRFCATRPIALWGWQAGAMVLAGLDAFADEFASHVEVGMCAPGTRQTVPCVTLCPAHVNVPAYIALAEEGRLAEAVKMIRKDNPFPTACALVCEHPCEERCRRTMVDAPVNIRGIKKYIVDTVAADTVETPAPLAPTGKRVAVVGAGPSGLTCAYFLGLMGHSVTVFERRSRLGGMMRYGIPAYRLPRERLDEDIRAVLGAGDIEVRTGCDIQTDKMRSLVDEFDAVYVAVGAQGGKTLPIEGADAAGVMSAVDVLEAIGDEQYPDFTGKNVVVIGGGNVAMDCARTAVRANAASVTVAYRRRLEDMTALPSEVEAAMMEGVEMRCLRRRPASKLMRAPGDGAHLPAPAHRQRCAADVPPRVRPTSPRCAWPPISSSSPWGRPSSASPSKSSECSMTAPSCGLTRSCGRRASTPSSWAATASGAPRPSSWPSLRARRRRPTSTSCWVSIIRWTAVPRCRRRIPTTAPPTGACRWPSARACERKRDFKYVEEPVSAEEAAQECGRCLRCDVYGIGALTGRGLEAW